ncbi:MAG TPA: ABC transporter ATP-binding protein [Candidatus Limnocylindrales bacterium]|nr:ABC transporter ATP-binding protein [Candidatus Limnocylindrales bacterium]
MVFYGPAPDEIPQEYRSWRRLPRLLLGAFRVVREAAPREFAFVTALQLAQGALMGVQLLVVRNILAAVLTGSTHHDYLPAIEQLAILVGLQAFSGLANVYTTMQQQLVTELVQRRASRPVTEVATTIGLRDFDTPEFHDRLQRAQQTATIRPLQVTNAVLAMGRSILGLTGVTIALIILSPLLLAIALLGFVPLWAATVRVSQAVYDFIREMTPNDRKRGYVLSLLTARDMAKEVRAFGLGAYLRGIYDRLTEERIARLRDNLRRRAGISLAGSIGQAIAGGVTFGVLAWLITTGRLSLAVAGAAAMATFQLGAQLQGLVFAGGELYESSLFIEDLDAFLALLPALKAGRPTGPAPRGFDRIEVQGVHFTYPVTPAPAAGATANGSRPHRGRGPRLRRRIGMMPGVIPGMLHGTRSTDGAEGPRRPHALNGISMEIRRGEVVALVGENGCGKTTLAKLICGLYPPDAGQVVWDGVDVATVDPDQLREQITVIFQDFVRYWLTARENIGIGRVLGMDDPDAIRAAAQHAGADRFIESWPERYEALLGPIFEGGKDLSTGQWQRIALARAFFRDAPLVILDEPTASLDARAEAELFARMRDLFAGRAVLLISHRFSSVRSADRIYVMREGEIIEHGSHEQLMALHGLYAELFNLQAAAYLEAKP